MVISTVVVDASLALKWVLGEPFSDEAEEVLEDWKERKVKTIAPGLLPYEAANALYTRVRRGEMTLDNALTKLGAMMDAGPVLLDQKVLHADALRLAVELGSKTSYEAHYLALAELEDCEFWTGDKGFWEVAKDTHPRVRWVGEGPDRPAVQEDSRGWEPSSASP